MSSQSPGTFSGSAIFEYGKNGGTALFGENAINYSVLRTYGAHDKMISDKEPYGKCLEKRYHKAIEKKADQVSTRIAQENNLSGKNAMLLKLYGFMSATHRALEKSKEPCISFIEES